jgi:hypothetical protein
MSFKQGNKFALCFDFIDVGSKEEGNELGYLVFTKVTK